MALAFDASVSVVGVTGVTSQALPPLTTSAPGNLVLFIERNQQPVTTVTSSGLSWALRTPPVGAEFENKLEEWTAVASTALTGHVITINFAAPVQFLTAVVSCLTGTALTGTRFDLNGSVPVSQTFDPAAISTSANNTIIIAGFRGSFDAATAGAGWTPIFSGVANSFMVVEYQIVSAPQTNLSATQSFGAGFANGVIVDALVASTAQLGNARISGSVTVGATPRARLLGAARISATATILATANLLTANPWSVDFSSAFGSGAQAVQPGNSLFGGSATLAVSAVHRPTGSALIGGFAFVAATGDVIPGSGIPGPSPWSVDFNSDFGSAVDSGVNPWVDIFTAEFGGSALPITTWFGVALVSGAFSVAANAVARQIASARISATASVFANAIPVTAGGGTLWPGTALIAGSGVVAATALHRPLGSARVSGAATLVADAIPINASGGVVWPGAARISGQATLAATARQRFRAQARIAGSAFVSASPDFPNSPLPPGAGNVPGAQFYLVRITARQPGFGTFVWAKGWGTTAWGTAALTAASVESTSIICASDLGYRSASTDTDGVVAYPALINEAFAIDSAIKLEPEGIAVGWQWGVVRLANDDGRFDTVAVTWNVDGRPVEILTGQKIWDDTRGIFIDPPLTAMSAVFIGVSKPWFVDAKELRLPLRDASYWIERPVNSDLYSGAGSYNGTAQLAGQPKPMARGGTALHPIRNVTPTLLDPVALIYQYNNAPGTVVKLYEGLKSDSGSSPPDGIRSEADTTNLYSGLTTPGYYRTDNSRGLFQLGSVPIHAITCDVTGEFPNNIGAITNWALIGLTLMTGDMLLPTENVDTASFAAAAASLPYVAGVFFGTNDNPDGATAVSRVLSSAGARLIMSRTGKLACFILRAIPPGAPFSRRLDTTNLMSLVPIPLPPTVDPPPYRLRLAWQHNYTVQTSDLNATADQAIVQFAATPDTYEGWSSLAVINTFKRPNDPPPFGGALLVQADAAQVVADMGVLWGETRALYEAVVPSSIGLTLDIGDVVNLVYPMGTLRSGQLGQIVGERFRSSEPTMTLKILAATSIAATLPDGVGGIWHGSGRYALIATVRATAIGRFAGRATIAGTATVFAAADVNLASGLRSGSALIGGVGTVLATVRLRAIGSARISVAATIGATAQLLGGVVPPGIPTNVSIDTNLDPPTAPSGVTVT